MRILHIIESMSPEGGGPAEVVRQLAQTAHRAGTYRAEIACLDRPGEPWLDGGTTLPIHPLGPGLGKYGYASRLDRWLQQNLSRFDGVLVSGLWQYPGLAVWKNCRGKVPYMVYVHGMLDPWFKKAYPIKHMKKALYWRAFEARVLRDARAVLFTAPQEAALAKHSFSPNEWTTAVVPYGTAAPDGDRDRQVAAFYRVCPQTQGKKFVLFLGRLHEKKGCDLLIKAFARGAADRHRHLVLAGPSQKARKAKLMALAMDEGIANRVHFPGMLHGDGKWGAFRAAEVFALPSHQENFGIAIAESLACGTPVLISDKVNIWREIVEDGAGMVDDDSVEGASRLLERWQNLPAAEKDDMAAKCRETFDRRFSIDRLPAVIANLFLGDSKSVAGADGPSTRA